MVFMEPHQLGHNVIIHSYCDALEKYLEKKLCDGIRSLMTHLADICIAFVFKYCKFPVPSDPNFLVHAMVGVFDCFISDWKQDEVAAKIPKEADEMCYNAVVFAHIWSIGCALDENTRPKFDVFFQEVLIAGEDVNVKYSLDVETYELKKVPAKLGDFKSVFDLWFERDKINWINWIKTLPPYVVPKDCPYSQLIVPTMDSIRVTKLLYTLLNN
jgi:dynein heavy chain